MTEATPTPMPPTIRKTMRSQSSVGRPVKAHGADEERHRCDPHHEAGGRTSVGQPADPAVIVPTATAPSGAEQRRGHRETEFHTTHGELGLDRGNRAVDYRAVITEQQAAKGRDRGDQDHPAGMFGFFVIHTRCIASRPVSHVTPSAALRDGKSHSTTNAVVRRCVPPTVNSARRGSVAGPVPPLGPATRRAVAAVRGVQLRRWVPPTPDNRHPPRRPYR